VKVGFILNKSFKAKCLTVEYQKFSTTKRCYQSSDINHLLKIALLDIEEKGKIHHSLIDAFGVD